MLIAGCDPKFFFGENVDGGNEEPRIPDILSDPAVIQYSTKGHTSNSATSAFVNEGLWSGSNGSPKGYSPAQGPWGIIPSRSIMISNLPKTTQLWTLVELLKVYRSVSSFF